MKRSFFFLLLFICCIFAGIAQNPRCTLYVATDGVSTNLGDTWNTATTPDGIVNAIIQGNLSGEIYIAFAVGEYYDVSINLSSLNLSTISAIHLIGGFEKQVKGWAYVAERDYNSNPTVFHADSNTPASRVISLNYFSTSASVNPSSIVGITVTSDNNQMTGNAINVTAGRYVISNCRITEYNTTNRLVMIETGANDDYIISSLFDNNECSSLIGLFCCGHIINSTIADNTYTYFIEGVAKVSELINSIVWNNSNENINNSPAYNYVNVSHSFVETQTLWMSDDNTNAWGVDPAFSYNTDYPYTCNDTSHVFNYGDGDYLTSLTIPQFMYEFDLGGFDRFYDFGTEEIVDAGAHQHYNDDNDEYYNGFSLIQGSLGSRRQKSRDKHFFLPKTAAKQLREGQVIIIAPDGNTYSPDGKILKDKRPLR